MNEGGAQKTSSEAPEADDAEKGYSNESEEEEDVKPRKVFNFNRAVKRPAILNALE